MTAAELWAWARDMHATHTPEELKELRRARIESYHARLRAMYPDDYAECLESDPVSDLSNPNSDLPQRYLDEERYGTRHDLPNCELR